MADLVDLVKISATGLGTGALSLGSAVDGFRGKEALVNGGIYSYSIQQDGQYEVGRGTWLASQNAFVRAPLYSSNGNGPVNFGANAEIAFTFLTEDLSIPRFNDNALAQETARAVAVEKQLSQSISIAAQGMLSYAGVSSLPSPVPPEGTQARVYDDATASNNGVWIVKSGAWTFDSDYYSAIATVVQPLVNQAQQFAVEAGAATGPTIRATTFDRIPVFQRKLVSSTYAVDAFGGVCVTALGTQLGDSEVTGFETWLRSTAQPVTLSYAVYSRPTSGAVSDGGGSAGDTLVLSEQRSLVSLPAVLSPSGTVTRVASDFLAGFVPDPTLTYLLNIFLLDAAGNKVLFGFLEGAGTVSGDPGYPIANGYYQNGLTDAWTVFGDGTCCPAKWLAGSRAGDSSLQGQINALQAESRAVRVGAPEGLVSNTTGTAAAGQWWNQWPLVQGGNVARLFCTATAAGYVTFNFGYRNIDGSFAIMRSASVAVVVGDNSFAAGLDFAEFTVEAGWLVGVETSAAILSYSSMGHSFAPGQTTDFQSVTLAFGAEISVAGYPVASTTLKQKRTRLWSETIDTDTPPVGFDSDPAIEYTSQGVTLAAGTPAGWATRIYTRRYVRTDLRVTRVWIDWTDSASRFAVLTAAPSGAPIDMGSGNSGVEIDGVNNVLRIKISSHIGDGSGGDPGDVATVPLGFSMTVGHSYLLEWSLNHTVHSAVLSDLTGNARSPQLQSGDPNFAGVDTAEGFQNGSLCFAFPAGNARITAMEVLHDGPSPDLYVSGDSTSKSVYVTVEQSWPSLVSAGGPSLLRSAQPGGTTQGAWLCAQREIEAARPRHVILATGINDGLLNIPTADYKWQLQSEIDMCRRVGASVSLVVVHPDPDYDPSPYRAVVEALASGQADIDLIRWDRALTVNGDGTTPNASLLEPDMRHPNVNGYIAVAERTTIDSPSIED